MKTFDSALFAIGLGVIERTSEHEAPELSGKTTNGSTSAEATTSSRGIWVGNDSAGSIPALLNTWVKRDGFSSKNLVDTD